MVDRPVATGAATTITDVQEDLDESSLEVAVTVTTWAVPGAVQAPVVGLIVPAVALQVTAFVAPPVTEVVKVVAVPAVLVGLTGATDATTTVCGVTVTEVVAVVPAAFVTVRV